MNKIDEILHRHQLEKGELTYSLKSQLKAEILKGKDDFEIDKTTVTGYPESAWIEAIPVSYINELFNEEEK